MKEKDDSPWGPIQTVYDHGQGVYSVSTAGHGGVFVPDELLAAIPEDEQLYGAMWSGSRNWYEEDCAALIPMFRLESVDWSLFGCDRDEIVKEYEDNKHYWENQK
jgi:hypothetical protein